jgi:hypothetical protein
MSSNLYYAKIQRDKVRDENNGVCGSGFESTGNHTCD